MGCCNSLANGSREGVEMKDIGGWLFLWAITVVLVLALWMAHLAEVAGERLGMP